MDHNQSIHRTVNRNDEDQFWSSAGSESEDSNEYLTYKVSISDAN